MGCIPLLCFVLFKSLSCTQVLGYSIAGFNRYKKIFLSLYVVTLLWLFASSPSVEYKAYARTTFSDYEENSNGIEYSVP